MTRKIRRRKERKRTPNALSQRQQLQTRNPLPFGIFLSLQIPISRKIWRRKQRNRSTNALWQRPKLQPHNLVPSKLLFLYLPIILQTFPATQP